MLRTPHSSDNQYFTDCAHMKARELVYPAIFNTSKDRIHYLELKDAQDRDYNKAIDRTIAVDVEGLHAPISFTVQERFRKPKYSSEKDIAITAFNNTSGLISELYKIEAFYMLYAYFDPETGQFIEVIMIRVPVFLEYLVKGSLSYEDHLNPRSNQTFYCFKFDDLLKLPGVVKFHHDWLA
ncbi:MAG: hypothetical protein PVS3B3_18940 [Ktedonobacteraceae bacterium]